jgi:HEAT repeat protein
LFAGVITLITLISAVAGAQILLQSSSRADREVVSVQDQHKQAPEAAAKSLGIIGDRHALEPLKQALQDADEQSPKKAVEALGLLKQNGGDLSMSMNALRSSNATERALAACALERVINFSTLSAMIYGRPLPLRDLVNFLDGTKSLSK